VIDEEVNWSLRPSESFLRGAHVTVDGKVSRDSVSARIAHLIANELVKVATANGGWSMLFLDPTDGRYWEHSYPESEMHGGGPPALTHLDQDRARRKYGVP
jgi:hypothetical protein